MAGWEGLEAAFGDPRACRSDVSAGVEGAVAGWEGLEAGFGGPRAC